jgi:exopolyphosphatase/guanosine-5'-triphosphate,3'-diphosphate pyrophosphatase
MGAEVVRVIATSAVREAANGPAFVQRVRAQTMLDVEVLSGRREAELTFIGATLNIRLDGPTVVVELGGGSTECVGADQHGLLWARSLQLGSARLTERFIWQDPPDGRELATVTRYVTSHLQLLPRFRAGTLIISGGTARRAATMVGIQGVVAEVGENAFSPAIRHLRGRPTKDIAQIYGIKQERAQILLPGIKMLQAIVDFYQAPRVLVTRTGIREGVIIDSMRQPVQTPDAAPGQRPA